jgi:hypothetical protein
MRILTRKNLPKKNILNTVLFLTPLIGFGSYTDPNGDTLKQVIPDSY